MRLIRTVSLSLALASVGAMLSAADLTVAEGEDVTLSESANYGTVTVLGNLTLAEDVVVTATGTLALNDVPLADGGAVPLLLDGTSLPDDLSGWTVTVDGVSKPRWRLAIRDGALVIEKQGLSVILK